MAAPSKAEMWTQISNFIALIDAHFVWTNTNSDNYLGLEDTLQQSLEGQHSNDVNSYLRSWRQQLNSRFSAHRATLLLMFKELAKFGYSLSTEGKTDRDILLEIANAMDGGSETVKNRAMTYGSISAGGSNVGSATIYRCTEDVHGNNLEIAVSGTVRADVVSDKNTGATQGNELVTFRGNGNVRVDNIQYASSTNEVLPSVQLQTSGNTTGLLVDGSFDTLETSSALTKNLQDNWTLNDYTLFERDASTFFRFKQGQGARVNGTGTALVAKSGTSDVWFAQYIGRTRKTFKKDVPYFLVLRVMVDNALTDGTLTLRLGTQTTTLDVSTLSANTWADVVLGTDDKGYFENFKENWIDSSTNQDLGVRVRVDVASRTVAGKIWFDEIVLAEGKLFNGVYYCPVAGGNADGSAADALVGDTWSWADSSSNTGRIQTMCSELLKFSFPHTSGTPTYADA